MSAYWLIAVPALPMAAAIIILSAGSRISRAAGWLLVAANAASLLSLLILHGDIPMRIDADLAVIGNYHITVGLWLDRLSFYTAVFVSAVALFVNLYACGYMAEEEGKSRFFAEMAFFTGAMLTLVLAGSFLLFFAAWEWVGLASFLLIGFWYGKEGVPPAAKNAFLITRIGDMGLFLGWLWVLLLLDTTDIPFFLDNVAAHGIDLGVMILLSILFFIGAIGKSAQLPLSAWLPPAMAGPTPVSALIHSATMVAAGVYLLLRLYPLFESVRITLDLILWVGGATALFAALAATVQTDFKRVLAWSTISQLGEMLFAIGLAGPLAAFFHLVTHGVFKSTLFLTAGAVEHGTGKRDLGSLGGLWRKMPVTAVVFAIAALALAGVPPFSGFFSEDKILAGAVGRSFFTGVFMLVVVFLAGIYISRAGAAVFGRWPGAPEPAAEKTDKFMLAAMIVLAVFAAGLGWALSGTISHLVPFEKHGGELSILWKVAAVAVALAGIGFGILRVYRSGPVPALGSFWSGLESGLNRATQFAGGVVSLSGRFVDAAERGFAGGALQVKRATVNMAAGCDRIEQVFDKGASGLAYACLNLADRSDRLENAGFSDGLDRFAALFGRAGRRFASLQTGKLYLYTMGLFVWTFLVIVLGLLVWIGTAMG